MTEAESWSKVRIGFEDCKFRRQHPLGIYITDFNCHKVKLVVEIDGSVHNNPDVSEHDVLRQKEIEMWGYTVIRFTNDDVIKNVESVIGEIRKRYWK